MNANHISIAALIISCVAVVMAVLPKTQTVHTPEVTQEDLDTLREDTHKSFEAHSSDLHHLDVDLLKAKGRIDSLEKEVKYLKHAKANAKQPRK